MNETIGILIIDDNEDDCMLYRRILQKSTEKEYHITEASDGEEGLKLAEEKQPACVLLDYSLPGRNGIEVLKRVRAAYPFLPIVMLTGQGNENVAVLAMQHGAQNYILKSNISLDSLEHVIHMAVEHCMLQKHVHEQRAALEVFTRALAHDLNEPVRTIRSYIDLISEIGPAPDKVKTYIHHVQNAADRMRMLIDTVFNYTKLDGSGKVSREVLKLNDVLHEVKENLGQLIKERGTIINSTSLPLVYANRPHMIQLLQNIICNAIKHTQTLVTIEVSASAQGDNWVMRIADNGEGIDPSYFKKIFEPFKRMSAHEEQGAGLGLAICKKIVESQNGKIWCESEMGQGAVFLFTLSRTLPITHEPVRFSSLYEPPEDQPRQRPLANILLVDDSAADTDMTRFRLLERSHLLCNVFVARSGEEALARLREKCADNQPIDLILLDITMPEMDGFEVLEKIRAETEFQKLSVVICSGSTYEKDIEKAKSLGAVGYLTKPIEFSKLKSVIDASPDFKLSHENDCYSLRRAA